MPARLFAHARTTKFFSRQSASDRSEQSKKLADVIEALPASVWAEMPQFTYEVESA
jgi:hypothetical protein